ncbi:hypothetical protein C7S20_19450 [Christiangramia fulva]|uniref:Uncharacterized protein n=1 Tax=Christiangramia fulva TaxID=2126553 RepID=A0A2R3ZAQ6_9FLAO|nr:hypothetical protein [Christiangramia fulva]AVR47252.1 hypothetical protein C7S20_19450 [Christiangramia fulva]
MAKANLINRNTGKEVEASDPDAVIKRFPKTFTKKPATQLNADVKQAEKSILDKNIGELEVNLSKESDVSKLEKLLQDEKAGKDREGAKEAISNRIASLKEDKSTTNKTTGSKKA